ncbi:MAG: succinate dehydrogenase cytochrome b subunit [Bacteroidetes bacterium]|nr:succinate dehydrogenase cytochrome b subunit [Bacteroidota bacterium]MBU1719652.1 succinate dehydrogenase cytochrome b subunit [Bacteroidota bacterium]
MAKHGLITSSIGKKLIVGTAGLFLMMFLLVHLSINLLLLRNDGGEWFNAASHFMGSNIIVKIFEVVLFGVFFIHIIYTLLLTFKNWASRPVKYFMTNKSQTSFFSKYMFHTGVIIFVFLVFHFWHFFFIKLGFVSPPQGIDSENFYAMASILFNNPVYSIVYIIFFVFLGFHLNHSLQSAFQTLGFNHNLYTPFIKSVSMFCAVFISVGFSVIPVFYLITDK